VPSENLRLAGSQAGDAAHRRGRICGAPTGRSAAARRTAGGSAASRRPGRVVQQASGRSCGKSLAWRGDLPAGGAVLRLRYCSIYYHKNLTVFCFLMNESVIDS
jgi:hypothetical protein